LILFLKRRRIKSVSVLGMEKTRSKKFLEAIKTWYTLVAHIVLFYTPQPTTICQSVSMKKRTVKRTFRDVSFAVQWSTSPCVEVERPSYKVGFDVYTVKTSVLFSTYYYPFKKESILLPLAYKVMNPDLSRSKKTVKTSKKSVQDKTVIS